MQKYIIYNPHGGSEGHSQEYSTQLCLGLLKNGIMVHLVTLRDFNPQEVFNKGASVTFADVNKYQSVMLRYDSWLSKILYGLVIAKNNLKGILALNQAEKEQKPNVCLIIGGETITNLIYILWMGAVSKIRYGLTIHNSDFDLSLYKKDRVKLIYKMMSKCLLKVVIKFNGLLFVHGKSMQQSLAQSLNTSTKKIRFYHVPCERKQISSKKVRKVTKTSIRLLFCGIIRSDKGFDDLCGALQLCKPHKNWILRVAGSPTQVGSKYIYRHLTNNKIESRTTLKLKYLSLEEIDNEYHNADIVVLPYKKSFIAQSVVMTDAVKWRKPVITTAHSQNGYSTTKYKLGWTFKSEDRQDLAKVLGKAIACLKKRRSHFNFDQFLKDHEPGFVGNQIISAFLAE